jgi:hypothetical protein
MSKHAKKAIKFIFILLGLALSTAAPAQKSDHRLALASINKELLPVIFRLHEATQASALLKQFGFDDQFSLRWAERATLAANDGDILAKYLFAGRGIYSVVLHVPNPDAIHHPAATDKQLLEQSVQAGLPLAPVALYLPRVARNPGEFFDIDRCEPGPEALTLKTAAGNGAYAASVLYQHILNNALLRAQAIKKMTCVTQVQTELFSFLWASNTAKAVLVDQLTPFRDAMRERARQEHWLALESAQGPAPLPAELSRLLSAADIPDQIDWLRKEWPKARSLREQMEHNMQDAIARDERLGLFRVEE